MSNAYDVIIIGSGPGGYVTAIRSAQLGLKTAIVEREHLGGICLNWGCIPTKALLRSAEIMDFASHATNYGLKLEGSIAPDVKAVVDRSRGVSARLNGGVGFLMKKNKVDVIWGEAKLADKGKVTVGKSTKKAMEPQHPAPKGTKGEGEYTAKHVIVATGARPRALPGIEPDGKLIWTYFEAMVPQALPNKLLVMGSGAIGIEFASFYNSMGCDVTVVELMPTVMPVEDAEISGIARKQLEKHGLKIITEAKVTKVEKKTNSVVAHIETKDGKIAPMEADRLISAVGVQGNIENLGLEALGIKTDRGCVVVDGYGRTNVDGIYAIGDVAGPPMLAHKAEHEGVICVEKIAGVPGVHPMEKDKIPGCTYCHPQVASVGLTEAKAKDAGYDIRVGRFQFGANGKAIALGEDQGMIKTIFDKNTGQLLGAHMVGAEVTELIQGFVVAMNLETTEEELMHTVFPHPTLSEMMKESVLDAYGKVLTRNRHFDVAHRCLVWHSQGDYFDWKSVSAGKAIELVTVVDNRGEIRARHPEKAHRPDQPVQKKPDWIRVRAPTSRGYSETHAIVKSHNLVTVCEEAGCPNIGECWDKKHATFMIMGEICTRACAFCNVSTGKPGPLDAMEPENVALAVRKMGLKHVVITSVDRDDLSDGGAQHFVEVIRSIREVSPGTTIEILTPDFLRKDGAIEKVVAAKPDVFNHNLETVPSNYLSVRPGARYFHSMRLLQQVKELDPTIFTKSGVMVGLGEERNEVLQLMDDLRSADVDFLTVGQYLQPTRKHHPVIRFIPPDEFKSLETIAYSKGFLMVSASPLTRSSHHAGDDFARLKAAREAKQHAA